MTPTDAERKLRELSFLHEVAQLASSARDWDEMLRIVIDRTTDAMRAEVSSLYLLEKREGLLRLVATNGLNPRAVGRATLRFGEGITGWVANARVPLAVRDVRSEPRWKNVPSVDVGRFTSMLSVPLVSRDEVIGVMNVQTVEPRDFDRTEIDFLQTIANQVAGIIEKGRLQRESERKLREVSALFEVSNVLTSTLDLDEVLALIVDRLVRVYPGSAGAIYLHERDDMRERARSGDIGKSLPPAARRAMAETRPIVEGDHVALPLLAGDRLLGAAALRVPAGVELADEEVAFVGALANQAALAIDKAALYALERQTTERLRELERARTEFVAVVTHDLRTPLSVIRGYLDLLAEKNGNRKIPIDEAVAQVVRLSPAWCTTRRSTRPRTRGSACGSSAVATAASCVSSTKDRGSRRRTARGSSKRTFAPRRTRSCPARASASSRRDASSRRRAATSGTRSTPVGVACSRSAFHS